MEECCRLDETCRQLTEMPDQEAPKTAAVQVPPANPAEAYN